MVYYIITHSLTEENTHTHSVTSWGQHVLSHSLSLPEEHTHSLSLSLPLPEEHTLSLTEENSISFNSSEGDSGQKKESGDRKELGDMSQTKCLGRKA